MDYYTLLGVPQTASAKQIKEAFRKKALAHHPDRFCNSSKEVQQMMSIKFKEVSEAYKVLMNDRDRATYDRAGRSGVHRTGANYQGGSSGYGYQQHDPFQSTRRAQSRQAFWRIKGFSSWSEFSAMYGRQAAFHTIASITILGVLFITSSSAEWIWNSTNRGKTFQDYLEAQEERLKMIGQSANSQNQDVDTTDSQLKSSEANVEDHTNDSA